MKANEVLENLSIDYELVKQDNPTKNCDDAAKERGVKTSQITKSLIIDRNKEKGKTKESNRFHVLLPGDREVSERKFGENRMVSPKESKEITGFESGTVHPFSTDLPHIVDYRLLKEDKLSFTIGQTDKGVIIKREDFEKALENSDFNYEVKDIALHNQKDIERLSEQGLKSEESRFILRSGNAPLFTSLNEKYLPEKIFKVLKELEREENNYNQTVVSRILKNMQNETHMQKLVQEFAETGEININEANFDLDKVVSNVLDENRRALEDLKNGQDSAINYLIGQVMKNTQGRAEADDVRKKISNRVD